MDNLKVIGGLIQAPYFFELLAFLALPQAEKHRKYLIDNNELTLLEHELPVLISRVLGIDAIECYRKNMVWAVSQFGR